MPVRQTPTPPRAPVMHQGGVPLYGRAAELELVLAHLAAGRNVVIEGERRMGKMSLRNAVAEALQARGQQILNAQTLRPDHRGAVVIESLDELDRDGVTALRRLPPGTQMLLTRTPPAPYPSIDSHLREGLTQGAVVIELAPLTREQNDRLIDDYIRRVGMTNPISEADRSWVWVTSGGIPWLAVMLLRDLDEAPLEEGALHQFSGRTISAASEVVAGLSPTLQRLAAQLTPLIGVQFSRLVRGFNRAELALLAEAHVISEHRGLLIMTLPMQTAVALLGHSDGLSSAARAILEDVCASVEVQAACAETEFEVTALALANDELLRALIPLETTMLVTGNAMWLARRRGDDETAAMFARRIYAVRGDSVDPTVRDIARKLPDNLVGLNARMAEVTATFPTTAAHLVMHCLQIPVTSSTPDCEAVIAAYEPFAPPELLGEVRALRASLVAARNLDEMNLGLAREQAFAIANDPSAGTIAVLRALTIAGGVCAYELNGAGLVEVCHRVVDVTRAIGSQIGIEADLARRESHDSFLSLAVSISASGMTQPAFFSEMCDEQLLDALNLSDPAGISAMALCQLLSAADLHQQTDFHAILRFLTRKRRTDLSAWAISFLDDRVVPPNVHFVRGLFITFALAAALLMTEGAQHGPDGLTAQLAHVEHRETDIVRVTEQYLAALDGGDPTWLLAREFSEASLPAAFADHIRGITRNDGEALLRAATIFRTRGLPEWAEELLATLAVLVENDPQQARSVRQTQREVKSHLRSQHVTLDDLTTREREVSLLAARGMRNREIADALFLSVRTVESHLYGAMNKLGATREHLATTLRGLGVDV